VLGFCFYRDKEYPSLRGSFRALIITDANNSKKQVAILAYLPFN
jgi:hypothetical protein